MTLYMTLLMAMMANKIGQGVSPPPEKKERKEEVHPELSLEQANVHAYILRTSLLLIQNIYIK